MRKYCKTGLSSAFSEIVILAIAGLNLMLLFVVALGQGLFDSKVAFFLRSPTVTATQPS